MNKSQENLDDLDDLDCLNEDEATTAKDERKQRMLSHIITVNQKQYYNVCCCHESNYQHNEALKF